MPTASYTLDLDTLGGPRRLDALAEAYRPIWGHTHVLPVAAARAAPLHRIDGRALGAMQFRTARFRAIELRLLARQRREDVAPVYCLTFPRAGASRLVSGPHPLVLRPGDFYLGNNWQRGSMTVDAGFETFHVLVPRPLIDDRVRGGSPPVHVPLQDSVRADMLACYLSALHERLGSIADEDAGFYVRQVADLVAFVLFERGALTCGDTAVVAAHKQRVLACIERHCLDDQLDAARIAAACGLSVRYLHQVFAGSEQSVMERVWCARLDHARRMLTDPLPQRRSISEIAYRSGFGSPAGFSRAFKRQFGESPRAARRPAASLGSPEGMRRCVPAP